LLSYIASHDEKNYVLLSFGRELKEIKYKFLKKFDDGVTAKAEITFFEEYQDDIMYVYFMEKSVCFWSCNYYIMKGSKRVAVSYGEMNEHNPVGQDS